MLDAIVSQIKTEIAIEGPKGVSRDKLWDLVQEVATKVIRDNSNNDTIQPTVDDAYKRFIWPFIVKLPEINYFEDTAQPMDLDPQQPSADIIPEHPQEETEQTGKTQEDNGPAAPSAKETPKKRKAPKKNQAAKKKKPKKKPAARKKKALDDDDDSSDEFNPDSESESEEEESDFDAIVEDESDEDDQEDEDNASIATTQKDDSENPMQKNVDTSGYRRINDLHMLSYDEVGQRYGSRLRLVADQELQDNQIYVGLPPGRPLSVNLQVVLGAIMRTRYSGLTQIDITKELELDPRSSGHYVKTLEQRGAIIRKPIVASGTRTNLCIHIRYNRDDLIQKETVEAKQKGQYSAYNVTATGLSFSAKTLRAAVVKLLSDAPDNVMYSSDILCALGFNPKSTYVKKWYYRSLDSICSKNVFRKLRGAQMRAGTSRLIQLVDPNQASKETAILSKNGLMEYNPTVDGDRQLKGCAGMLLTIKDVNRPTRRGLMYDMSAEPQLLNALYEAGVRGATQKDLGYTLSYSDGRSLYKCLERLTSIPKNPNATRFIICRNFEFEGRIRRYRYFTHQAYIKLTEGKDVEPTGPPNPLIKESELIEIDYRKGVPGKKRKSGKKGVSAKKEVLAEKDGQSSKPTRPPRKNTDEQTQSPASIETQSVQIDIAKEGPTTRTTRSQTQTCEAVDTEANNTEEYSIKANTNKTANIRESQATSPMRSNALASIFLTKKRTRSQALAAEEDMNDSTSTIGQTADESADTTTTAPEPPKRQRQTRVRKLGPKESDSSEQSLSAPQIPKERNAPKVIPTVEEVTMPVETTKASSSRTATGSHKRRNLFDYFTANPQRSPSPAQNTRVKDTEALPTAPRFPGALYQHLVTSSLEENTGVPEGDQTIDTVSDEEIDELLASGADTNTEEEEEEAEASIPNVAVDTMDVDDLSNAETTTESEAVPITASATAINAEKIIISRKQQSERAKRTKAGMISMHHLQPTDDRNAYLVTRKKILLKQLEEQPIIERSKINVQKFLDKYKATYGDTKMARNLDIKTFWRTATCLVEDGDAYITTVEIAVTSNRTVTKKVLVRSGVELNGPEFKAYKEDQSGNRILNMAHVNMAKLDRFDKTVERLSERLARMEDTRHTIMENSRPNARRLLDIKQIRSNVEKSKELIDQVKDIKPSGNWLMIAVQYGFAVSSMIRVKLFHQYLLNLLYRGGDCIDQERRIIQPSAFVDNLPLGLCLQTVGFFQNSPRLREFTKDSDNLEIRLADIPADLKEVIMSESNKFRRRVRQLIQHLLVLKIIGAININGEPLHASTLQQATSAPAYVVYTSVPIIDFWSPDRHVVREYSMETTTDILVYWSELQYFCLNGGEQRVQLITDSAEEEQLIKSMTITRNWITTYLLNRDQRKILNAYVNKKTGETPLKKTSACRDIAKSMDLPVRMIINYFEKMEAAFKRKLEKPIVRALENSGGMKARRPRSVTTLSSFSRTAKNVFKRTEVGSTVKRLLKAQKEKESGTEALQDDQSRELYMDDETMFPRIDENVSISSLKLRRSTSRINWTIEEDELLVYTYVILKSRAERNYSRFYWTMIELVLPHRIGNICRQRFAKIKTLPEVSRHMTSLFSSWSVFYTEGILNGEIEDKDPHDMSNFDLLGHLAYFIKQFQAVKHEKGTTLPDTREEIESKYDVQIGTNDETGVDCFEDKFHSSTAALQKHGTLCDQYFGFRGFEPALLDTIPENLVPEIIESKRIVQLIMVFIRMILFTPDDMYDPFFAYGVLHQYPQEHAKAAVEHMRSLGQLVHTKSSRTLHRRIPGYRFGISERYLNDMASEMPENFHLQANEYEKYLASHGAAKYVAELVSSGMMGCILNLTSLDKLNYGIQLESIQWLKHKIPLRRTRLNDERVTNVVFSIEGHDVQEEARRKPETPEPQVDIKELDEASLTSILLAIQGCQRKAIQPILTAIKVYLNSVEEAGADLIEIKENILAKHPGTSDAVIRECLDVLTTASPPLVHRVGFSTYRYVLTTYLRDWVVIAGNVRAPVPKDEAIAIRTKKLAEMRKEVFDLRIWNDVNGKRTTDVVAHGCMVSVLERVLGRPGIRERDIVRLFKNMLTYVEVKDTLEELVKRGALRKTVTNHTSTVKVTLFSKRRSYSAVDPVTISRNCQTCYWATSDYYRVLAQSADECQKSNGLGVV